MTNFKLLYKTYYYLPITTKLKLEICQINSLEHIVSYKEKKMKLIFMFDPDIYNLFIDFLSKSNGILTKITKITTSLIAEEPKIDIEGRSV